MKPTVYMMLGLPGSGKTTYSKKLESRLGIPRFSLDEEYFAIVGNNKLEFWDFEIERQISDKIKQKALAILKTGQSVIVDYCPWPKPERDEYRQFIEKNGAECHIVYFDIPKKEILRRLHKRNELKNSGDQYITPRMLNIFYKRFDPPEDESVEIIKT